MRSRWSPILVAPAFVLAFVAPQQKGCAKKSASTAPVDLTLQQAVDQTAKDLSKQLAPSSDTRTLVVDPFVDRSSKQATHASQRVEEALKPAIATTLHNMTVVPGDRTSGQDARFVLTGTLASEGGLFVLRTALSDRQSTLVVAQSAVRFRDGTLDGSPTKIVEDSPAIASSDAASSGRVATAETPRGRPADTLYLDQLKTSLVIAEGDAAYNAGRWDAALAAYTVAVGRPDGQSLTAFNGLYLSNVKLGRMAAAEEAFGKLATLGLAKNSLAVKLLFKPSSATEFWDASATAVYSMWARQIARATRAANACLNIVGHTSHSGSESINQRLSLQRAETVKRMLEGEVRDLAAKVTATGIGFSENIIGTGTDDARDAVDRRVEFKVVPCRF